ncbi:spore germination protein [Lysinibacillus sp. NPDC092081]|uniref:spore germination protein n=1 Tax=Lysinibacillus sp. NPDC092081 TaxID=3364131 RepID=UPI0037FB22E7
MDQIKNLKSLKELFKFSADVMFQSYNFFQYKVHFITCDSMIDEQLLNGVVVTRIQSLLYGLSTELLEIKIMNDLHLPNLKKVKKKSDAITLVYTGNVLLYFEEENILFSSDISKKPNRNPEETLIESVLKGPRDNFIEDIFINIALIRKRLPTNSFSVENFEIGRRSKTKVAMLYMNDITDKEIVNEIKKDLKQIDTDIVFSGDVLMGEMGKVTKIIPKHDYTGRPDFALQALMRGRVIILVDGVSYAIIVPINITLLFKTSEDYEYPIIVSSVERLLRLVGIFISMFLPGFWIAITTFHQEQLPIYFLATLVEARTGNVLPVVLEMFLMLLLFELFYEANLRLPSIIVGTLSIVGGLIIGNAAVKVGLTSAPMLIVFAISSISGFTLVNQSFIAGTGILRFLILLGSAIFGLFGFFISMFFIFLYLANVRVYGVPYLTIVADLDWPDFKKSFVRLSQKGNSQRPKFLKPQDKTRTHEKL